jgi:uncharacterized protein
VAGSPSARTRVRRLPARAAYDRETICAILDEAPVAHLGFVSGGQPIVIPTLQARVGGTIYIHGSAASRAVRTLAGGAPACLTVTILDGLVLARSVFHHSVNYRSVVVLGNASIVGGAGERAHALEAFVERLVPRRWSEARPPSAKELKATSVMRMTLDECSAKVRTGGPVDDEADRALDVWAGVIPLRMVAGTPVADDYVDRHARPPESVRDWISRRR